MLRRLHPDVSPSRVDVQDRSHTLNVPSAPATLSATTQWLWTVSCCPFCQQSRTHIAGDFTVNPTQALGVYGAPCRRGRYQVVAVPRGATTTLLDR